MKKVDALMKLVASKSAPIDFNDMPLSTLIEIVMNLLMWILLVGTILVITRIVVILILGCFLAIPLIIMVIPMEINLKI